jgi:hypothetical protein
MKTDGEVADWPAAPDFLREIFWEDRFLIAPVGKSDRSDSSSRVTGLPRSRRTGRRVVRKLDRTF